MASTKLFLTYSTPPKSPQNSPKKAQKFFALIIFASPFEKKCVFVFFDTAVQKYFQSASSTLESQHKNLWSHICIKSLWFFFCVNCCRKPFFKSSRNFLSHFVFFLRSKNVFLAKFYLKKYNDNFPNAFS